MEYPVHYHIIPFDMKYHRPTVINDVNGFCVRMNTFCYSKRTFPIGSSRIRKCLYLTKYTVNKFMSIG